VEEAMSANENGSLHVRAAVGLVMYVRFRRLWLCLLVTLLSFAAGARGIVAKSASAKELPTAIKEVCEGKTFVSESLRTQLVQAGTGDQSQPPQLSGKEREVVRMLASGMTVSQIAARVNRSISTISKQKSTAMNRLCISTDVDLFHYARSSGMVP
jgi:two-component system, NarL family, captular synthesis response regulator RcsB